MTYPTKKLGEVCDFKNGLWTGKKPPFIITKVIRNTNFKNNDGTLNLNDVAEIEVEEKQLKERLLEKGDLILERSGGGPTQPVGRVVYFDNEAKFSFSNFTSRIRIKDSHELDSKYLWRYLNLLYISGVTERLQKQTTGIRNLMFSEYKDLQISLPPLAEQKKIVAKLEKLLVKVNEAKKLRAEAQASASQLLPAELHKIFEEGKKKGWELKTMNELSDNVQYGYTASAKKTGNAKLLRITDIQDGDVEWDSVPSCEIDNVEKYKLESGDIVFARTGATVGKSYLITNPPKNAIFASYLIRLQPGKNVVSDYTYYFFQSPEYWSQITEKQAGGAQPNVNGTKLKNLVMPTPPLPEQRKIVARLDSISEKVKQLKEYQKTTSDDLLALEQSILSKAFSGEFV